ncbi:hypothetical protein CEXT_463071 [Caerostris extrusa]|uniref:Uncharacterized protein n=1 Tax=Caerostris extrusa TaxID=172846 RepID=A0AAV4T3B2_CAEEX|nr:hypothetical protein CEXT_463071 [Caerostris extrusa]
MLCWLECVDTGSRTYSDVLRFKANRALQWDREALVVVYWSSQDKRRGLYIECLNCELERASARMFADA